MEALIISNVLLWIAVVVLSGVVFALMRQIGVLHERVAPAGALMNAGGPQVGEAAPVLALSDWLGVSRTVGGARADGLSTLLLFVSPTCPVCKTILSIVMPMARGEKFRLLLASDGARTEHDAFVRENGLAAYSYFLSTELGLAYQVGKLPYAVLIGADGVVRGKGLVNTREHLESLFTAQELGVASLQEYIRHHGETAGWAMPTAENGGR
jgi:methylamine dehydrogenase accessory protein MauD